MQLVVNLQKPFLQIILKFPLERQHSLQQHDAGRWPDDASGRFVGLFVLSNLHASLSLSE